MVTAKEGIGELLRVQSMAFYLLIPDKELMDAVNEPATSLAYAIACPWLIVYLCFSVQRACMAPSHKQVTISDCSTL